MSVVVSGKMVKTGTRKGAAAPNRTAASTRGDGCARVVPTLVCWSWLLLRPAAVRCDMVLHRALRARRVRKTGIGREVWHGVASGASCETSLNKHVTPHLHRSTDAGPLVLTPATRGVESPRSGRPPDCAALSPRTPRTRGSCRRPTRQRDVPACQHDMVCMFCLS